MKKLIITVFTFALLFVGYSAFAISGGNNDSNYISRNNDSNHIKSLMTNLISKNNGSGYNSPLSINKAGGASLIGFKGLVNNFK